MYDLYNKIPRIHPLPNQLHSQLQPIHSCVDNVYRSVSIVHPYTSYPYALDGCFLVSTAWSVAQLSDITPSLIHDFPSRRYPRYSTPSHLYDMHYGLLAIVWTFREASYRVIFNLYSPFTLRPFGLLRRMQPHLHAHVHLVCFPSPHLITALSSLLIFMS